MIYIINKKSSAYIKFYTCWENIKKRCDDTNAQNYKYYGGKGIKYDKNWVKFERFYDDMYNSYIEHLKIHGEKNTTIERIDVNGNYTKQNCTWATWKEQFNNRSSNVRIEINQKIKTLTEWSDFSGVPIETIWSRYNNGIRGENLIVINKRMVLDKQSGVKGIRWLKRDNKWVIDKYINGKKKRIASFNEDKLEDAVRYFEENITTGKYLECI